MVNSKFNSKLYSKAIDTKYHKEARERGCVFNNGDLRNTIAFEYKDEYFKIGHDYLIKAFCSVNPWYKEIDFEVGDKVLFKRADKLCKKYFGFFPPTQPIEFLIELNKVEYKKLNNKIILIEQQIIDLSKNYDIARKSLESILRDRLGFFQSKFINWFYQCNVDIPLSSKNIRSTKPSYLPNKDVEEKQEFKLTQNDAFELLKNLEKQNYVLTTKDTSILKHESFKRYKSDHIKRLVGITFDSVFAELDKQTQVTHQKFFAITRPPSGWYEIPFIESFNYHCTNKKDGKYYHRCKGRKFNKNKIISDNGNRRAGIILK